MAKDYVEWSEENPGKTEQDYNDYNRGSGSSSSSSNDDSSDSGSGFTAKSGGSTPEQDAADAAQQQINAALASQGFDTSNRETDEQREARERREKERRERREKEREERERKAREKAARERKERAEREAREKAERERKEREAREKAAREAQERAEREAAEERERFFGVDETPVAGPPVNEDGSPMSSDDMIDAGIDPSTGQPFVKETSGGGIIPPPATRPTATAPPRTAPPSTPAPVTEYDPVTGQPIEVDPFDDGEAQRAAEQARQDAKPGEGKPSALYVPPVTTLQTDTGFQQGDTDLHAEASGAPVSQPEQRRGEPTELFKKTVLEPLSSVPETPSAPSGQQEGGPPAELGETPYSDESGRVRAPGVTSDDMPVPEEHTPPTQVRVTDKSDFRQAGLPAELGDTPYRDDADVIGVAGTTDAGTPVPEGHTPPSRPAPRSPRTASAIPGDVLPTGDEDITSGAVSEHDQAIIDRKRELRGGVDFEGSADRLDEQGSPEASRPPSSRTASAIPGDILPTGDEDVTSGAVETTPEGYEQHPSGLLVPTASAIPGDVKPTGDEDVTSGAVREQAMRTRAFGGAIAGIATNVGGGLRNFGYTQLHNTAVGIGQVFGYPHQAAWAAHDKVTGQTSDEEAPSRSFEQLGTIVEALPEAGGIFGAARGAATGAVMAGPLAPWGAIAGGYAGYRLGEKGGEQAEKVAENIPIVRDIPLLSLVPGQDLAKASEDFRIEGGEWFDVAATPLDVVPIKLGMGLSIARQTYRSVAPTQVGGGFISLTSPGNKVPRLFGSEMDEALHATSIDVRRQLATKGDAEFTIGGDTFKIDQTRLDEAIRKVNLNRHLSATGATDVSTFEKGGPVPTLNLPSGRVKPPEDQFQFRTLGGTGIEDFADTSAFGFKGGKHAGMVVYGDDWGDLVIPGFKGKDKYYGGWELEGGVPTEWHRGRNTGFTPGETAPVRRVTGIGDGKGLYLDETLVSPSYTGRVHANVLAVVDKAKHPFAASTGPGAFVRRATPDEIAQARFGKNFDELDDGVGPGRDDGVGRGRGRDDGVGPGRDDGVGPGRDDGVGPGRDDGVGPGRDDGVGPGRDDGVGPGRDDGVGPGRAGSEATYVARAQLDDLELTKLAGQGDETAAQILDTRAHVTRTLDDARNAARRDSSGYYQRDSGVYVPYSPPQGTSGIDPETGLLREDFATGDSPATPRRDGVVGGDGVSVPRSDGGAGRRDEGEIEGYDDFELGIDAYLRGDDAEPPVSPRSGFADDSPATPRRDEVEGGDGVSVPRSASAPEGMLNEREVDGYDDGIDPETGLLREDFADDSPATPRRDGVDGTAPAPRSDGGAGRRDEGEIKGYDDFEQGIDAYLRGDDAEPPVSPRSGFADDGVGTGRDVAVDGYDDFDPESGLLRDDFVTGDSPATPRRDGVEGTAPAPRSDGGTGRRDDGVGTGRDDGVGTGRDDGVGTGRDDGVGTGRDDGVGTGRDDGVGTGRDDGVGTGRDDGVGTGRDDGAVRDDPPIITTGPARPPIRTEPPIITTGPARPPIRTEPPIITTGPALPPIRTEPPIITTGPALPPIRTEPPIITTGPALPPIRTEPPIITTGPALPPIRTEPPIITTGPALPPIRTEPPIITTGPALPPIRTEPPIITTGPVRPPIRTEPPIITTGPALPPIRTEPPIITTGPALPPIRTEPPIITTGPALPPIRTEPPIITTGPALPPIRTEPPIITTGPVRPPIRTEPPIITTGPVRPPIRTEPPIITTGPALPPIRTEPPIITTGPVRPPIRTEPPIITTGPARPPIRTEPPRARVPERLRVPSLFRRPRARFPETDRFLRAVREPSSRVAPREGSVRSDLVRDPVRVETPRDPVRVETDRAPIRREPSGREPERAGRTRIAVRARPGVRSPIRDDPSRVRKPESKPTPNETKRTMERRGYYPGTVEWQVGTVKHNLDLVTGDHKTARSAEQARTDEAYRVLEWTRRRTPRREIDLGPIDIQVDVGGLRYVRDREHGQNAQSPVRRTRPFAGRRF